LAMAMGRDLLLDNEDLRGNGLDLGHHVGDDELLEVDATEVVDEAELELVQAEAAEVEAVEHTGVGEEEEVIELLELEDGLDVKRLLVEQTLELEDVEVVLLAEETEQVEVQGVDVGQVVEVDLVEALEAVEQTEVDVGALLRGGRSDQGGEGRDEDGGGLHFCWCGWMTRVKQED